MNAEQERLTAEAKPYRDHLERLQAAGKGGTETADKLRGVLALYADKVLAADRSPGWVVRARRRGVSPRSCL